MFKNYLATALRNLLRRKWYSFINIIGLTFGLACCLIIFQYVAFEYSFDDFNANAANLYRVIQTEVRQGGEPETDALYGYALGPALAQAVPEVVNFARLHPDYNDPVVSKTAQPSIAFEEKRVYYADPTFLQMFTYPLVVGEKERALADPGTVPLSESTASKYFGSDILLPITDLIQKSRYSDSAQGWSWHNFNTYVQIREDANRAEVERKFTDVLRTNREDHFRRTNIIANVMVQPLADVHLNETVFAPKALSGSYGTVYFFTIIGLVTLLIALVNYVNLTTARSLDRAREVGVRKVVGAARGQLVLQFLLESALTNLAAMMLAIGLAEILRPLVNNLAGTRLTDLPWTNPWLLLTFIGTFFLGTLLAGLYPAFVLSSFRPVAIITGKAGAHSARLWLRQGLVILQFAASIALIVGTAIVYSQLEYMRNMDLGINLEQILTVPGLSLPVVWLWLSRF